MDINLLKDLAHLRLAIAYRQFDENKKSVEEFENIIKQTPDLRCKALAYTGKMISLIKEVRNGCKIEDKDKKILKEYNNFIESIAEDFFMKFYAVRFDIEVLKRKSPCAKKRIKDIIKNAAIPIYSYSDKGKSKGKLIFENIIANVPTEWFPEVLANFWEVLAISYIYQNEGHKKEIDICFKNAEFHAKRTKSNFGSPTIFSESELKDINVERFITELKPDNWKRWLLNAEKKSEEEKY